MSDFLSHRDMMIKYHTISVPANIKSARVELLTFRGAPAFIGTQLAKLHFDNESLILYSKMSGVVNFILIENDQQVSSGQALIELRNINTAKEKSRRKLNKSCSTSVKTSSNLFGSSQKKLVPSLHVKKYRKFF